MRRSSAITLTLLASAGLGLAFCDTDQDTEGVLETQGACVERLGASASAECEDVFRSARLTHATTAPRFKSPEACLEATGTNCTPLPDEPSATGSAPLASTAASVFIPTMAGVMIGRALSDGTRGATPVYAGAPPPPTACPPGVQGRDGCPTTSSSSSSGGGSSGGGRRYWYSGGSYAGFSENDGRSGFQRASTTTQGSGLLSRNANAASGSARSSKSSSRAGGLGFSAAAHGGSGS